MNGSWRQGPGLELFSAVKKALGGVPILAEDLGVITTDVVALRWGAGRGEGRAECVWGGGADVHWGGGGGVVAWNGGRPR